MDNSQKEQKKKSKQLQYYYRKTAGRAKRKYECFDEQENPSRQLKRYHNMMKDAASVGSEKSTDSDIDIASEDVDIADDIDFENAVVEDHTVFETASESSSSGESDLSSSSDDMSSDSENEDLNAPEKPDMDDKWGTGTIDDEPLYQGSKISKILSFVLIISFVLKHNLSKAAWADLLRLIKALLGERCRKTFNSVYRMKIFMKEYFGSKEPTRINYCAYCLKLVNDRCPNCRGAGLSSFLDLHFEEKIKELFRDSEFLNLLKKGKEQVKRAASSSKIYDIFHGLDYKNFLHPGGFLTEKYNISFTINTDGVNKYSSSKAGHLWPVYVIINELPKEHRYKKKYVLPAYIYCDKHDPNMSTFLNPLIEKLNVLNAGGINVPDSADGNINVRGMLFVTTADLPARADLMNMKQYNGKCGCHLCKSEGQGYGPNNIHRYWPYQANIEKRIHEDQQKYAAEATIKQPVMGVKGHCIFSKLSYSFDLVRSFAIDWMHCVCLGVVKYIMQLQMSIVNKGKLFYIGGNKTSISNKILAIKPPDIVGRMPRTLEDLKHWKATELKNWLLHYSITVLYKELDALYVFHWSLLVGAIGILCSDSITSDDLKAADSMLQDFVLLMGVLYEPTKCTMNIHLLQHLTYYVSRRGPLWAYSCFAFESVNAYLKPLVHGTHHAMEQIGCAIALCYGLPNFTKKMLQKPDILKENKHLLRHLNGIPQSYNKNSSKVDGGYLCGKEKPTSIDGNMKTLVMLFVAKNKWPSNYELEAYRRFDSDEGQKFYSLAVKTRKTDSTVIEYTDDKSNICYGRVKIFLKIFNHGICICNALNENIDAESTLFDERECLESLQMLNVNEQDKISIGRILEKYNNSKLVKHQINIKKGLGKLLVISVEQIRRKCVFIDVLPDMWVISRFPNVIEHN